MSQTGTNQNSGHSGQRTDALIKLALVFFVSLLSFSVGTYVGKKYSDNQHKLALLEPKKEIAAPAALKDNEFAMESEALNNPMTDLPDSAQPAALTDAEVAQLAEEFANDATDATEPEIENLAGTDSDEITSEIPIRTITESGTTAKIGTIKKSDVVKPATSTAQPPTSTASATVTNAAPKKMPSAPVKNPPVQISQQAAAGAPKAASVLNEEREPASLPPKTAAQNLRFTVQIGSYPSEAEAEKMSQELLAKGYKSSFVPARVNGQVWYRVNVGVFGSIKEAQDYKKEFLEKTRHSSAIIQRIQ